MSTLQKTRSAQRVLASEFVFNFGDTMADVNGVTKTFGSVFGDAGTFEVMNMPNGAVITGGELLVETAGVGPTVYTVSLGVVGGTATALLAATSVLATGRTALTGLGLASNGAQNVTLTIASTVANATAGKVRARLQYTIDNRAEEAVTN